MFGEYVFEYTFARYNKKILLIDDGIEEIVNYSVYFAEHGFEVLYYKDDLSFRISHGEKLADQNRKITLIVKEDTYIPYDICLYFKKYILSYSGLFNKLNVEVLKKCGKIDLELLCLAYQKCFENLQNNRYETEKFIEKNVYNKSNIQIYVNKIFKKLQKEIFNVTNYKQWFSISERKADIDVLIAKYNLNEDTSEINRVFKEWIINNFGKLSTEISKESPVLVSKVMEFICDNSKKFILIIMDGMSEFDWHILSKSFNDIDYEKSSVFAMIPSTTSVSRQCLLANKYPSQLIEPWKQSKEKEEFYYCAKKFGFTKNQIGYKRSYNTEFSSFVICGAVIINEIDNIVHAQQQGRIGMFNDIRLMLQQHKLADMTKHFLQQEYDVYITSDHGNTLCTGIGKLGGTGIEVETKSRRMLVIQDFADKDSLIDKYGLIEYPKYYLSKEFDYLICDIGDSFDTKGVDIMTHGGISIDEVIIPFIKVKAGKTNG